MLIQTRLFLANCDSVRSLPEVELRKRLRLGLLVSRGVALSPNMVVDNVDLFNELAGDGGVASFLKSELGEGALTIRGEVPEQSFAAFLRSRPDGFRLSSEAGRPTVGAIRGTQAYAALLARLQRLDAKLRRLRAEGGVIGFEPAPGSPAEFRRRIAELLRDAPPRLLPEPLHAPLAAVETRSEAYALIAGLDADEADRIRLEIIDPAYNALFVNVGEAFVQDRIPVLDALPPALLRPGLEFLAHRTEREMLSTAITLFDIVAAAGQGAILKWVAQWAFDTMLEKAAERAGEELVRRNWFGLYSRMSRRLGIEFKT